MIKENKYYKCSNYIGLTARCVYPLVVVVVWTVNNIIIRSNTYYDIFVFLRYLFEFLPDRCMGYIHTSRGKSNIITLIILLREIKL